MPTSPLAAPSEEARVRAMELLATPKLTIPGATEKLAREFSVDDRTAGSWMRAAIKSLTPRTEKARQRMRARLTARFDRIYELAMEAGDLGNALRALESWAKMFGLNQERPTLLTGQPLGLAGGPRVIDISPQEASLPLSRAEMAEMRQLLGIVGEQEVVA